MIEIKIIYVKVDNKNKKVVVKLELTTTKQFKA